MLGRRLTNNQDTETFKSKIFELSEAYEQDCFIFKRSGRDEVAYEIATNDNYRKINGPMRPVGFLKINTPHNEDSDEAYTSVGSGSFKFED